MRRRCNCVDDSDGVAAAIDDDVADPCAFENCVAALFAARAALNILNAIQGPADDAENGPFDEERGS